MRIMSSVGGSVNNTGIKEVLGMSTDIVKGGQHTDFGFGLSLPFIGKGCRTGS